VAIIAFIILTKTKMGRYIFAIGSNKEAARLSGINVKKWEMMAYVTSGVCAGIGGIAFPAVYTTVMPAQGQGFELYAIAAAVIGGTSLSGGVGSIFGTLIGVFIISVLRSGLPAMDLQAHYQTFFTGVVVIGAVLLDIYRNKKASEVRILSAADRYRTDMNDKIRDLKQQVSSAAAEEAETIRKEISALKQERNHEYRKMKIEEKRTLSQVRREERQADEELKRRLEKEAGEQS
jgi:ribose transport system permease protein